MTASVSLPSQAPILALPHEKQKICAFRMMVREGFGKGSSAYQAETEDPHDE